MSRRFPWMCLAALSVALCAGGCTSKSEGRQGEGPVGRQVASDLRLSPDPAFAASRIGASFTNQRIAPRDCRFQWKRNGSVVEEAQTNVLDPSHFSKGDVISLDVIVSDPETGATQKLSASIEVINSPPRVTGVTPMMAVSAGTVTINANARFADPDGDGVSCTYQWFKNNQLLYGETGASLALSILTRGDNVAVEVTASDGESSSPPYRSHALEITNHPPQFSSQPVPPTSSDETFRYKVVASDPDRDVLAYELVSGPPGMIMVRGDIVWALPPRSKRRGEHRVSIKVTDSKGGEAIQDFSLRFD